MLRTRSLLSLACVGLLTACTAFEDAEPTRRQSFVHFYSSAAQYVATAAEVDLDGGYLLSGEVHLANGVTDALIIKTDSRGRKIWERTIPSSIIKAIKPTETNYILVGDSIKLNGESSQVHELVNSYARLMIVDKTGNIIASRITQDSVRQTESGAAVWLNVDYYSDAVTFDHNGNIIVLGSYRIPGETMRAYLASYAPGDIRDSLWQISYAMLDNDYVNCNSVHITSSGAVWASRIFSANQNLTRQHTIFPLVRLPEKTFEDAQSFGNDDNRNHAVEDVQRSPVGFAAIGTYAETNGESANIFFVRLNPEFSIVKGSELYIDGQHLLLHDALLTREERIESDSQDEGLAIAATDDGFVLACSITSTPLVGNGGKDILLIKLDPFGNLLWKKLLGGSGDEVVAAIRETPDKGLLIFGTNTINGLSSMMLIKTDANGNLDK